MEEKFLIRKNNSKKKIEPVKIDEEYSEDED
jgi:hypothetical protein